MLHEIFHLARHARQTDDEAPILFDDEARRGAHRILDRDGALRKVGLPAVVLTHRHAVGPEARLNLRQQFIAEDQLAIPGARDGWPRHIIHRGAEAARRDDHIRSVQRDPQRFFHPLLIIADNRLVIQVQADLAQAARDVRGVGIDHLTQQQFTARGNDFGVHASLRRQG